MVGILRFWLEYVHINYPSEYWIIKPHTSPIMRCLEYFLGMLMVPIFLYAREKTETMKKAAVFVLFTVVEAVVTVGTIWLIFNRDGNWLRGQYAVLFCLLTFVYSFDSGLLSWLLSTKPFALFGKIQFEFFILHMPVLICFADLYFAHTPNWQVMNACMFATIIVIAVLYRNLLSDRLSRLVRLFFRKMAKWMGIDMKI